MEVMLPIKRSARLFIRRPGCALRVWLIVAVSIFALGISTTAASAAIAQWSMSSADWFSYPNAVSAGIRALSPSFTGGNEIDTQSGAFVPRTAQDPARTGGALLAFDTSVHIEAGHAPNRYAVSSVKFKSNWTNYGATNKNLLFDE
jgi:hypothetical protein